MDLSGKKIIVTGGARGMGAATVAAYVEAGALASDGSRFVTGQLIPVDGGLTSVR